MAPDLDIFIKSDEDPILFLEYHRQFTHSLIFIPFGALICSLFFYMILKKKLSFREIYLFSFFGYGSHGLLDACTSYGTQLLWPFTNMRVAWDNVSIIDPMFTIPILILLIISIKKKTKKYSIIALVFSLTFLIFGVVQRERAESVAHMIAKGRGHTPVRLEAKPSFGNFIVWKTIYEYEGRFYVDAVKLLLSHKIYEGESVKSLVLTRDIPNLDPDGQVAKDIERFRHFSANYLALDPDHENSIMDMRYSMLPNKIKIMWGITYDLNDQNSHVKYKVYRANRIIGLKKLYKLLVD